MTIREFSLNRGIVSIHFCSRQPSPAQWNSTVYLWHNNQTIQNTTRQLEIRVPSLKWKKSLLGAHFSAKSLSVTMFTDKHHFIYKGWFFNQFEGTYVIHAFYRHEIGRCAVSRIIVNLTLAFNLFRTRIKVTFTSYTCK